MISDNYNKLINKILQKERSAMILRPLLIVVVAIFALANPIIGGVINTGFLISQENHDADLTMENVPRNMIEASGRIELSWEEDTNADLRYSSSYSGSEPDQYRNVVENPLQARPGFLRIDAEDVPVGIVYCIVDAGDNGHSAVFQIIRTASSAPEMIAPVTGEGREGVNTVTPTFRWQPVQGVSFYHLVVSDQPFEITNVDDQVKVEGASIIWQAITSETSIMYGIPDPSEFFDSDNIPPLIGDDEDNREGRPRYAWVVLNNFGNHPAYTSSVTGGVSGFEVEVASPFDPPELISPSDSADVNEDEIIFRWTQVEEASSYFIYVARKEITPGGSEALVPAWNAQTTETAIGCPAGDIFMAGRNNDNENEELGEFGQYVWKVIAANQQGRGSLSESNKFQYFVESGLVLFNTSTEEGSDLQFVELTSEAVDGAALQPFSTDDTGFHERFVPLGTYRFYANKTGYVEGVSEEIEIEQNGEYRVSFSLEALPATVIGSVTDDEGDPIASATVVGENLQTGDEVETETNISGEYQLDVDAARWSVSARANGYAPSDDITIVVEDGDNYDMNAEHGAIALTAYTFTITGYVRNPAGQPIQLAQINLTNDDGASFRTYTPEAGTYSFNAGQGDWLLNATKAGFYLDAGNRPIEIVDRDIEVNFTLVPLAGILSGQIFVDGNAANQDADAWFIPDAGEITISRANQIGGYSQGLSPGDYVITPVKEGFSTDDRIEVSIGPGETLSGVRLELWANPSSISGRIVDAGDESLPGVTVSAVGVTTTSDGQGNYTLDVPSGDHVVLAAKHGYATEEEGPVGVEAGDDIENVNIRLVDNAGSISGRIRRGQDPIFEAIVTAVRGDNEATSVTSTDRSGNYSFGLRYGEYRITVEKGGFIARGNGFIDVQLQAGQEVTGRDFAMLNYSARITGSVRSAGGPVSTPLIRVVQVDNEDREYNTTGNVEGRFAVTVMPEARYVVYVTRDGYSTVEETTDAMEVEGEVELSFEINALPCQISGRVLVDGSPLGQVTVRAEGEDDSYEALTDGSGVFRIDMNSGDYQLLASKPGYSQDEGELSLSPGENIRGVDFGLDENFSIISGSVSDPDDERIADVSVLLIETASGRQVNTDVNMDGAFTFERILPGSYIIETSHQQYADGNLNVGQIVSGQERRGLSVTMSPLDAVIEGVILVSGDPLAGVTVYAYVGDNEYTARSNDNGEYVFLNVAQGRYFLLPGRAGFTAEDSDSFSVDPGDRVEVNLEMTSNDGLISISVRDDEGVGLRDARVTAFDDQGHFSAGESGPSGTVDIENLYPLSEYTVTVQLEGYSTQEDTLTGIETGDEVNFVLLPNELEISGTTVNQAGTSIPETAVQATSLTDGSVFRTTSADNSEYLFEGLAKSTSYRVQTHRFEDTYTNVDRVVETDEANIRDERLEIVENSASISGSVGIREVSISARSVESGRTITVYSGADGTYSNLRLMDGSYVLKAERLGYSVTPDSIVVANLDIGEGRDGVNFNLTEIRVAISGRVLDGLNAPMDTVVVLAWSQAGESRDTTDQNGVFGFEGLFPNQTYQITSELPNDGYDNNTVEVEVGINDVANAQIQVVRHNATITGVVRRLSGDLLSGVLVTLDDGDQRTTGEDGVFIFRFIEGGVHSLTLSRRAYVPISIEVNTQNGEGQYSFNYQLEGLERAIYGEVSLGEFGFALNAVISVTDDLGEVRYDTTTANGIFGFNQLDPERIYEIRANKKGYASNPRSDLSVIESSINVNIAMARIELRLSGVFQNSDGENLSGSEIILQSFNNTFQIDTTDFAGDFSIPIEGGSYMFLGVDANNATITSYNSNLVIEDGESKFIEFSLSNAGEINGELQTEDGDPPVTAGYIVSRHEATGILIFNWSNPDGTFKLRGLRPGIHVIAVEAAGYAMIDGTITFTVSANTSSELSVILTQSGKAITGYITQSNGDGVSNARVNISGPSSGDMMTNDDGYYTLLSPEAGSYTISAEKSGYTSPDDTTFVLEAGGIVQIDRTMNPVLNSISGVVNDEFRGAMENASVILIVDGTIIDSILTNEYGEYQFSGLSPGEYRVKPRNIEDYTSEPGGRNLTLAQDEFYLDMDFVMSVVRGVGNVIGNVTHGAEPLSGAFITLTNLDLNTSETKNSDTFGDFAFNQVTAPFTYRLVAVMPEISEISDSTFRLTRDETANRQLSFPASQISVVLMDLSNEPIPNRAISIIGETILFDTTLFSDANGQAATIEWLVAGKYSVLPHTVGQELPPEPLSIELGNNDQVALTWHLGWTVAPPPPFNFADSARVEIAIPDEVNVNFGNLYWQGPADVNFSSKPLLGGGAGLVRGRGVRSIYGNRIQGKSSEDESIYFAFIPAQSRSGTLLYYLEVHTIDGFVFGGPNTVQEVQVTSEGLLDHLDLVRTMSAFEELQLGVPVQFSVSAFDNANTELTTDFGNVEFDWTLIDSSRGQFTIDPENNNIVKYLPEAEGNALLRVTAAQTIAGVILNAEIEWINKRSQLDILKIVGPADLKIADNDSVLFTASATDVSGASMPVLPIWHIENTALGTLDVHEFSMNAMFYSNEGVFGRTRIAVVDSLTGKMTFYNEGSSSSNGLGGLQVYGVIRGDSINVTTFVDGKGLIVHLPPNTLDQGKSAKLSLDKISLPNVMALTPEYEAIDFGYNINIEGSLNPGATYTVIVPIPEQEGAYSGKEPTIGVWNPATVSWNVYDGFYNDDTTAIGVEIDQIVGLFTLLSASDTLAVSEMTFNPNPFSPNHSNGGLSIEFRLSSNLDADVAVSLKIYNMAGELIRTLIDGRLLPKGSFYRDAPNPDRRIIWNGLTNSGRMARNGRYLVTLQASDAGGRKKTIGTAVLIK